MNIDVRRCWARNYREEPRQCMTRVPDPREDTVHVGLCARHVEQLRRKGSGR